MASERWYPIDGALAVPWSLMERCRAQLKRNHDQSPEELARRGGLSAFEALCAIESRRLTDDELSLLTDDAIRQRLEAHVAKDLTADRDRLQAEVERLRARAGAWKLSAAGWRQRAHHCEEVELPGRIHYAVTQEREACAAMMAMYGHDDLAAIIRARGESGD